MKNFNERVRRVIAVNKIILFNFWEIDDTALVVVSFLEVIAFSLRTRGKFNLYELQSSTKYFETNLVCYCIQKQLRVIL